MDKQQRNIINGVLHDVVKNMTCSKILLLKLVQENIVSNMDLELIESKSTNTDRCHYLIQILLTRPNAYLKFYEALVEQNQTGASNIILTATKNKLPDDYVQMLKFNKEHGLHTVVDDIKFQHPPPNTHKFVSSEKIKILIITTLNIELTTKKITDTVPNVHIRTNKIFRKQAGQITLWKRPKELGILLKKLSTSEDKNIIVTGHYHTNDMLKEQVKVSCKTTTVLMSTDTFCWIDLTENCQTKIFLNEIRFLNELLTLEKIFDQHELEEDVLENLDEQFLVQLINNKTPSLLVNTIPYKPEYYVTRSIMSRCMLSFQKIKNETDKNDEYSFKNTGTKRDQKEKRKDIYLFSGLEQAELTLYFSTMTNSASNQIHQGAITAQIILLEAEFQFALICELITHPVHWIHCVDKRLNRFMWIKSRGDITPIQKMIDPNIQDLIPEDEFAEKIVNSKYITDFRSPICIVDSPGMGKTELLMNIGRRLQTAFSDQLVVFERASEFTLKLQENVADGLVVTTEILNECIQKIVCGNRSSLSREVLSRCINKDLKINLLLDGYDEIPNTNIKLAENILRHLSNSHTNIRLIVSSRLHNLESLERTMNVLSYKLLPFSKHEQHQFLVSYWTDTYNKNHSPALNFTRLEQFASQCLIGVEDQISMSDREFAGIPLQCLLIGIVFKKSAWEHAKPGIYFTEPALNISVNSLSDLFKECIKIKFHDSVQKHQIVDFDKDECMYAHACHAVKLLFPEFPDLPFSIEANDLYKFGIVEKTQPGEVARFLHRTFAEYFVSWVAVEQLQSKSHKYFKAETANLLLEMLFETSEGFEKLTTHEQVTFDFDNWVCLYFINQKCDELNSESCSIETLEITFDHRIRHIALACAKRNFLYLLQLFLNTQNAHLRQSLFLESLVVTSVTFAKLPIVKFVCEYFEFVMFASDVKYELRHITVDRTHEYNVFKVIHEIILKNLLHVAVYHGQYDVVEYLCKEKGFDLLARNISFHCKTTAKFQLENNIEQQLRVREYLCELNNNFLMESIEYLMNTFQYTHPKIRRQTFQLMRKYKYFMPPVFVVLELLPDEELKLPHLCFSFYTGHIPETYFYIMNKNKHISDLRQFVLSLLSLKVKLSEKILNCIATYMDLNTLFDNEPKYALESLSGTTNLEYLKQLLAHDVNFSIISDGGKNLLHLLPPQASIPFVGFLIEVAGVSVNLRDKNGNTPLHYVLQRQQCNESIIKMLIQEMLLDENNEHDYWENLLKTAAEHDRSVSVKIFLNEASRTIKHFNTSLYHAVVGAEHDESKQIEIVESLMQSGAEISNLPHDLQLNINSGKVTITFAMFERLVLNGFQFSSVAATNSLVCSIKDKTNTDSQYQKRLFKHLIQLGADINVKTDNKGNTLLHEATQHGQLEFVRMLIENGLDPNSLNNYGQTPLHFEIKNKSQRLAILEVLVAAGGNLLAPCSHEQIAFFKHVEDTQDFNVKLVKLLLPVMSRINKTDLMTTEMCTLGQILIKAKELGLVVSEYYEGEQTELLLVACISSTQKTCVEALKTANLSVNTQDENGNTPLHWALSRKGPNLDIIKSLLIAGADVNITNNLGHYPVEYINFGSDPCLYTDTFKLLGIELKNVSNITLGLCLEKIPQSKSSSGFNFISALVTEGINLLDHIDPDTIAECLQHKSFTLIRLFHGLGWNLATIDTEHNTILHTRGYNQNLNPETFHYILDYAVATGNDHIIAMENDDNETPLISAVKQFDVLECSLELLKKIKTDVTIRNENQMPLIATAVKYKRSEAFIKLLQKYGF